MTLFSRRLARPFGAAAAAAALTLAPFAAAQAASPSSPSVTDPTGDLSMTTSDTAFGPSIDITKVTASYSAKKKAATVTVHFKDLLPTRVDKTHWYAESVNIVVLGATKGNAAVLVQRFPFAPGTTLTPIAGTEVTKCAGLSQVSDTAANTITVTIPRSCAVLGGAGKKKVQFEAITTGERATVKSPHKYTVVGRDFTTQTPGLTLS